MEWLDRLMKWKEERDTALAVPEPAEGEPVFRNEEIADTLNLGWHFSEGNQEFQMAKIANRHRATHMYVIGSSGSGKTKFLEFLIQQDIEAGKGFGLIDPHGDLTEDVKGFLALHYKFVDDEILNRVVVVDPTDPTHTVTFNLLEKLPGVTASDQAQELLSAFKKIWGEDSWGPRMENRLRGSLVALAEAGLTLGDLPQFLTSQEFRRPVLEKVTNPIVKADFEHFDSFSKSKQAEQIEPITNKANAFLSDDRIRLMLSSPQSSFNLRNIMDSSKILLVKLDKGKLRESADLLGSLIMAKLQMAAFSRSEIAESERVPFYLYIDEFQNFATDSFGVVLSEARKYGLSLVMAHQTLAQVPLDMQSIILGNTGVQVYFRINRKDAELLAKEGFAYSGFDVKEMDLSGHRYWGLGEEWERYFQTLQRLPPRFAYVAHKIEGGMLPFVTVAIEPTHEVLGIEQAEYRKNLAALGIGRAYMYERTELVRDTAQVDDEAGGPGDGFTDEERALLEFIYGNPDTPVSGDYKGVGMNPRRGNELKEEMKERGLVEEIETRMGKGGRVAKFLIPTFEALEKLGKEPPPGRGGVIHRHVQQMVVEGARAKGYIAEIEKPILGGAVDVHLEKDGQRIAVEVAVVSKPERELAHIRHCLDAGYDRVISVFADERLMERTQEGMGGVFSDGEMARVRLVPLSKVGGFF